MKSPRRNLAAGWVTGLLAIVALGAAKLGDNAPVQSRELEGGLDLRPVLLQAVTDGAPPRHWRITNPAFRGISAWISAVGAGAAIADIAGEGRPSDICLVDARFDTVTVMPAPGTGDRFRPFALVAPANGYRVDTTAPMGCVVSDFNEDGWADILVYYWGRAPVIFQRASDGPLGAGSFQAMDILARGETWFTNAALTADLDGDGKLDLLFGNYFPDDAAVLDPTADNAPHMQRSMSRGYNGGGLRAFLWKDATGRGPIYTEATSSLPRQTARDWGFNTVARKGWTLALGAFDLDGDLRPEVYAANDFGPDLLLKNNSRPGTLAFELTTGERDLLTPRSKVLGEDSFKGMGVDAASITGDGRPTIAVSNISEPYALIESHFLFVADRRGDWTGGRAPFRDEGGPRGVWLSGWGWDIKFADLTNAGCKGLIQAIGFVKGDVDRWPELQELAMTNDDLMRKPGAWPQFQPGADISGSSHDRVYLQRCGGPQRDPGRFYDVSERLDLGERLSTNDGGTVSRGIALGDVYGDGRLSMVIARQWMPSVFLCNRSDPAGQAIVLNLRAPGRLSGDRPLVGATAAVRLPNGRIVTDAVDGGSGHSGKRAPEIHLGLGAGSDSQVHDVQLRWRDATGIRQRTVALRPGRYAFDPSQPEITPISTQQPRSYACG